MSVADQKNFQNTPNGIRTHIHRALQAPCPTNYAIGVYIRLIYVLMESSTTQ